MRDVQQVLDTVIEQLASPARTTSISWHLVQNLPLQSPREGWTPSAGRRPVDRLALRQAVRQASQPATLVPAVHVSDPRPPSMAVVPVVSSLARVSPPRPPTRVAVPAYWKSWSLPLSPYAAPPDQA